MSSGSSGQSAKNEDDLDVGSVVVLSEDQSSVVVGGEVVVLGKKSGMYYRLSGVGATIWELLGSRRTLSDIVNAIVSEYEVDADQAREDAVALLESLREEGLLRVENG